MASTPVKIHLANIFFSIEPTYSMFLSDPGVPGLIFVSRCLSVSGRTFVDFTDVTLADEDTHSILTRIANRAIRDHAKKVIY